MSGWGCPTLPMAVPLKGCPPTCCITCRNGLLRLATTSTCLQLPCDFTSVGRLSRTRILGTASLKQLRTKLGANIK